MLKAFSKYWTNIFYLLVCIKNLLILDELNAQSEEIKPVKSLAQRLRIIRCPRSPMLSIFEEFSLTKGLHGGTVVGTTKHGVWMGWREEGAQPYETRHRLCASRQDFWKPRCGTSWWPRRLWRRAHYCDWALGRPFFSGGLYMARNQPPHYFGMEGRSR